MALTKSVLGISGPSDYQTPPSIFHCASVAFIFGRMVAERIADRPAIAGHRADPVARNDNVDTLGVTQQPDGQITKSLSSPRGKNIPLSPSGKSAL
ncbi:hypothetical protein [Bradyrhizobium cenepequi]